MIYPTYLRTGIGTSVNLGPVTSNTIALDWTPIPDTNTYQVTYTGPDGQVQQALSTTPGTILTGLNPVSQYDITVRAITNSGQLVDVGTTTATTGIDTSVTVGAVTSNTIDISWTPVPGTNIYQIIYTRPDGQQQLGQVLHPTTDFTLTGLTPASQYDITVRAFNTDTGQQTDIGTATVTTGLDTTVTLDSVTENTVTLSWTAIDGSTFYQVLYRPTGSTQPEQQILVPNGPQNSQTTLTGLTPATMYDIRVVAFPGGAPLEVGSITPTTGILKEVIVDSVTPNTIALRWTNLPDNINYEITYTAPDGTQQMVSSGTSPNIILTGLTPATLYDISVRSTSNQGQQSAVGTTTATTVPTQVSITETTPNSISAGWTEITNALTYRIDFVSADGLHTGSINSPVPPAVIDSLQPGTTYTITVLGTTVDGQTIPIGSASATTGIGTSVNLGPVTSSTIALDWTPIPNTNTYQVIYTGPDGQALQDFPTTPDTILTGLNPVSQYDITVRAITNSGQLVDVGTTTATTGIDTSVTVGAVTPNTVDISWTPVPGTNIYQIIYTGPDGQQQLGQVLHPTTDFTLTGLTPASQYDITVRAFNTDTGQQTDIDTATATTGILNEVMVDSVTPNTIALSWTNLPDNINYEITYTAPDGTQRMVSSGTSPNIILTGLTPDTQYDISVRSTSNQGQQSAVGTTTATTVPTQVSITETTPNSISAGWTEITNALTYRIDFVSADGLHTGSINSPVPPAVIDSLQPGTTYTITVLGTTVDGQTIPIGSASATTGIGTSVNLGPVTSSTIALDWTPIPNTNTYQVIYTGPDGQALQDFPTTPDTILTGLNPVSQYDITVRAITNSGQLVDVGTTTATTGIDTSVTVGAVTPNTVDISWTPVPGTNIYQIIYTGPDGQQQLGQVLHPTTDFTLTGLTPASQYDITVRAFNTDTGQQTDIDTATATTGILNEVMVDSVTPNTIALSWTNLPDNINYEITYTAPDGTQRMVSSGTSPNIILTGLTPDTQYDISVRSTSNQGQQSAVGTTTATTVPTQVSITETTPNSISAGWTEITNALTYRIDFVSADGLHTGSINSPVPPAVIDSLQPGTTYTITVLGTTVDGQTIPIGSASATTGIGTSVNLGPVTSSTIALDWTPIPNTNTYQVIYTGPDGQALQDFPTTPDTILTGLNPVSQYDITVRAITNSGQLVDVGTTTATTGIDTSVTVGAVTPNTVDISWTPVPGTNIYQIIYTGPDGQQQLGQVLHPTTDFTLTGLTPASQYDITVRAFNTDTGQQTDIDTATATTGILNEVMVDSVTPNTIALSWTNLPDNINYEITYTAPDGTQRMVSSGTSPTIILTGLTPDTQYDISVRSTSNQGQQSAVGTTTATTVPTQVSITETTPNSISAGWTEITNALTYRIDFVSADGLHTGSINSPVPPAVIDSLQPGTTYTITVLGTTVDGQTIPIGSASATTGIGTSVNLGPVTSSTIALDWTPIPNTNTYQVIYTGPDGQALQDFPTTPDTILTGLNPVSQYDITVRAITNSGQLVDVGTTTATTGIDTSVTVGAVTPNTVDISWTPVPGTNIYQIIYTGPDGQQQLGQVLHPTTDFTLTGLTPASQYDITVRAFNTDTGQQTDIDTATATTGILNEVMVDSVTPNTIALSWTNLPDNINYEITYTAPDGTQRMVSSGTSPNIILTGLTPDTQYDISVRSTSNQGQQSAVGTTTATTVPTQVSITETTPNSISAGWTEITNALTYRIDFVSADGLHTGSINSPVPPAVIDSLQPGTTYTITVLGTTVDGQTIPIGSASATTGIGTSVNLGPVTSSTIALDWTPIPNTNTYQVIYTGPDGQALQDFPTTPDTILTGLNPVSQYDITVRAITNSGQLVDVGTTTATTGELFIYI
ncbi:fibronectin-like [Lytechinus pictus]|uniref:fibronectin-like n=1 Tax=Lytechinus pictus TaxID=7653 RepID=UPI0030B9B41B